MQQGRLKRHRWDAFAGLDTRGVCVKTVVRRERPGGKRRPLPGQGHEEGSPSQQRCQRGSGPPGPPTGIYRAVKCAIPDNSIQMSAQSASLFSPSSFPLLLGWSCCCSPALLLLLSLQQAACHTSAEPFPAAMPAAAWLRTSDRCTSIHTLTRCTWSVTYCMQAPHAHCLWTPHIKLPVAA